MKWEHVKAILWLRWRLSVNQWKRGGTLNAILGAIFFWIVAMTSVVAGFVAVVVGFLALPKAEPEHLLLVFDAIVVGFLFFWMMGLITELQKSEALSLDKLLHFPVSPRITFLLNYVSSFLSLSLAILLSISLGLAIPLVVVKGPCLLAVFPLLASFVLMVTAITHQFREWLFALMVNKRRRRTIIVIVTTVFIILVQIPNIVNITFQRNRRGNESESEYFVAAAELESKHVQGEIDAEEYAEQLAALDQERDETKRTKEREKLQKVVGSAQWFSKILPVGWFPYGVSEAVRGNCLPALLGTLGATAIGITGLWRSYRASLRLYLGDTRSRNRSKKTKDNVELSVRGNFVERKIRWVPDPVAAVLFANLRALMRAPEAKLLLLTPLILLVIFGIMLTAKGQTLAVSFRPAMALGSIAMTLMCFIQLQCNMFGIDRGGFRVYVLSPCRRQDILAGKNLSIAPLAIGMCLLILAIFQILRPMFVSHLVATMLQSISVYFLYCLIGNATSVLVPTAVSTGSLKPRQTRMSTIVVHLLIVFLAPVTLLPGFAAWGAELAVSWYLTEWHVPIFLLISIGEVTLVQWIYRRALPMQGRLLQQRETKILEVVSKNAE